MKNLLTRYTYPFLETIRIEPDGNIFRLIGHQRRIDRTFRIWYPGIRPLQLARVLEDIAPNGLVQRCRIMYNSTDHQKHLSTYNKKTVNRLIPTSFHSNYSFKWVDRDVLNVTTAHLPEHSISLLCRGTRVLETPYANVIVQIKDQWYTPLYPLLQGVQLSYLLRSRQVQSRDLHLSDVYSTDCIKLVNAMMPIDDCITLSKVDQVS